MIVKARAEKEIYKNEDFRIISFSPLQTYDELELTEYFNFSCKGKDIPYITIGKSYDIEIEKNDDGRKASYRVLSCPSLDSIDLKNLSRNEAIEILMDCTSSSRIANNILDVYPNFIELIMTEGKESIDTKLIKGVGEGYLNAYSRELLTKYKYYHILKKYGMYKIDVPDCKKLIEVYRTEDKIEKAIKETPYFVLIEVLKRNFEFADKMIFEYRKDLVKSFQRCESLIAFVLKKNELEGSSKLSGTELYNYVVNKYNVPYFIPMLKDVAEKSEIIYYDEKTTDLAIMSTYVAECQIANFVKEKLKNSHKLDIDWSKYKKVGNFEMTDMQLKELELFCNSNITILSGVSGSGKTSSVKALVKLMEDNHLSYCLLAPTGSASLKIANQTNRKNNVSTIHRKVLREKEIFSDVIIVDEMSMVGIDVFVMLINAISNENCRIVLVGDPSQIPSISLGSIFSDMIRSKLIPQVMLTKVFRYNTNGGSFVGENIRQGKPFLDNKVVKRETNIYTIYNNYKFIQCEDNNLFDNVLKEYNKLTKKYRLEDIIILSPFNIGECGTRALNQAIECKYNPSIKNEATMSYKIKDDEVVFKIGSRVVNIKNNYKALTLDTWDMIDKSNGVLGEEDVPLTELFNGEIGTVKNINEKRIVCQFDERLIVFTKANIKNLLLARAISIHRAQGGEWKAVINIISPTHERMLSKNLLYVSDTRGKEYHCDIGDRNTLERALLVDSVENRRTWLEELLINE